MVALIYLQYYKTLRPVLIMLSLLISVIEVCFFSFI